MDFKRFLFTVGPIAAIVLIGATLRFVRLEQLTTFSGDQGYDFLIVKKIVADHDFTLLGPKIGPYNKIGNLYLGPAYYYLLAPTLLITRLDPIGAAAETVIFAILTIILIYLFAKKFLSYQIALFAAALYSFNTFLINQSRAPSNPHMIPLFSILYLYSLMEMLNTKNQRLIWAALCGISLGVMFQLHYIAFALSLLLIVLLAKAQFKKLITTIVFFIITISPQIVFELRNEFFVTNLFIAQIKYGKNISNLGIFTNHVVTSLQQTFSIFLNIHTATILVTTTLFAALVLYCFKNKKYALTVVILTATLLLGLVATGIYSGNIEPHYLSPIYAQVVILIATLISFSLGLFKNFFLKALIFLALLQIFTVNLSNLNLKSPQGYTMPQGWNLTGEKKAAKIIASDVDATKKFNIAQTLDGDTRAHPLRYLVEVYKKTPQGVEHYPDSEIIYLVARDDQEAIKGYTVWEISSFKPFVVKTKWEIQNGINLYKITKEN